MKYLIAILGTIMIGQAIAGDTWHNMDNAFAHEDYSEKIDCYQHFLSERKMVNVHSYVLIEGNSEAKIVNNQQLILLNVNIQNRSDRIEILKHNADVVCLRDIPSHKEGYAYYQELRDQYAYFYVETSDKSISLIASKCGIEDPMFTSFGEDNQVFDFVIISAEDVLGHIYVASLQDESALEDVMVKIEQDDAHSKALVPSILCSNLSNVTTCSSDGYLAESVFLFQPKGSVYEWYALTKLWSNEQHLLSSVQLSLMPISNWDNWRSEEILCGGRAEVSASQDTEGNTSVGGSVTITESTDSGTQYSGGVSGTIERDSDGNTSGKVEVKGSIDW